MHQLLIIMYISVIYLFTQIEFIWVVMLCSVVVGY